MFTQNSKPIDPIQLGKLLWPNVYFYKKQREIIYSVMENDVTVVPAGNMLGKDFVSAFITLWFFLTRIPCRIVTTSADFSQLEAVLWGEMRRFIQNSKYPLEHTKGGPLVINHLHIRRALFTRDPQTNQVTGSRMCGISYILGRVAAKGEGLLGHHAYPEDWDGVTPHTLAIVDEASGVEDITFERLETWAKRQLVIGNPFPCTNSFYKWVKAGDEEARTLPPSPVKPNTLHGGSSRDGQPR